MTIGVDLTDELYYVTFLDGWLKDGLGRGENLVVHQTAALIVFPAAQLYTWIVGSERGLVLFLRFIFLAMACAAGLCQYRFIRRVREEAVAWSSALLVLCFIPFSLPAPSYNTIGMFGMLSALALFGVAALPRRTGVYASAAGDLLRRCLDGRGHRLSDAGRGVACAAGVGTAWRARSWRAVRSARLRNDLRILPVLRRLSAACGVRLGAPFANAAVHQHGHAEPGVRGRQAGQVARPVRYPSCIRRAVSGSGGPWHLAARRRSRPTARRLAQPARIGDRIDIARYRHCAVVPAARYRRAARPGRALCAAFLSRHRGRL